jgi:hypothetical protein
MAGAMQLRPVTGTLAGVQADLQQELLVSASASGIDAVLAAIEDGVRALVAARSAQLPEET